MGTLLRTALALMVVISSLAAPAKAAVVDITLGPGPGTTCTFAPHLSYLEIECDPMFVEPHPAWEITSDARWFSGANTGFPGSIWIPPNTEAAFRMTQVFDLPFPKAELRLWISGDDTISPIVVNGVPLNGPPANFVLDFSCADGVPGCEFGEAGLYVGIVDGILDEQTGKYLYTGIWDTYQVGPAEGTPIATKGYGTASAVPVPAALPLMAAAFGALVLFCRRGRA